MKPEWCNRELFVSPMYYTVCTTEKMFHRELRRMKLPRGVWPPFISKQANATVHHFENTGSKTYSIVCICKKASKARDVVEVEGLLIHEAVHLWQATKDYYGETKPGDEQEAYAIQRFAQSLLAEYRRQTK